MTRSRLYSYSVIEHSAGVNERRRAHAVKMLEQEYGRIFDKKANVKGHKERLKLSRAVTQMIHSNYT